MKHDECEHFESSHHHVIASFVPATSPRSPVEEDWQEKQTSRFRQTIKSNFRNESREGGVLLTTLKRPSHDLPGPES
jgi:hypothetical protein